MLPAAVPMKRRAPVPWALWRDHPWALWRDHQDGYAAPLEQQLSRSSCGDGRWVRGSGGDDGARGGHGAGGCRGRAGAARRRQREVSGASVERCLRAGLSVFERGWASCRGDRGWPADLSTLDLNWVTFFVNHGKPHRGRKFSQAVGGAALDLRITLPSAFAPSTHLIWPHRTRLTAPC